jgi:tRNA-binding EMAP/Myf-like protein
MKQENEKFCQECGSIINSKAEICPSCGVRQVDSVIENTNNFKNNLTQSDVNVEVDLSEAKNAQIMGILSVVLLCCFGGLVTIVLGYLGMSKGKKAISEYESNKGKYTLKSYNQAKSGKLFGTIGLVLSILYLIGLLIYLILVFIVGMAGGLQ